MVLSKHKTYFNSLNDLSRPDRYAVLDAVNQMESGNRASLGLHDEPLHGRSEGFRSFRANQDVRVIYRPFGDEGVLCFAGHHEAAYAWAEHHRCTENPVTHVVQIYEEVAKVAVTPVLQQSAFPKAGDRPYPFQNWPTDDDLLTLGVPAEQIGMIRGIKNEDDLLTKGEGGIMPDNVWDMLVDLIGEPTKLTEYLAEARANAMALAAGSSLVQQAEVNQSAMSAFSFISGDEVLNRMRDGSLDAWRVFLHPEQKKVVQKHFRGPVKIVGGAGTGKTVVALHRVKWLLENAFPESGKKILLTTFTNTLAGDLKKLLAGICSPEQMGRVEVQTLDKTARDFLVANHVRARIDYATERDVSKRYMQLAMKATGYRGRKKVDFFLDEYELVVEAEGLETEDAYLNVSRRGRSSPATVDEKRQFWTVFAKFRELFARADMTRRGEAFNRATSFLKNGAKSPYSAVVVDEVQDLDAPALRFVAALSGNSDSVIIPDSLVLVGDAHQRIYGKRVPLSACGIQTRGRSKTLKMNYRSTQKIRLRAESILAGVDVDDLDEEVVSFRGGRSLVLGESPEEVRVGNDVALVDRIKQTITRWKAEDNGRTAPGCEKTWADYAVLVSTNGEAEKMVDALDRCWIPSTLVSGDNSAVIDPDHVRVMTMHRAKGLEFSGVVLVVNADKWPRKPTGYDSFSEPEKESILAKEKALLYVAMTRAIAHVLITGIGDPPPEFPSASDGPSAQA